MDDSVRIEAPPAASGSPMPEGSSVVSWIRETMKRNAPVLRFHPDEKYVTFNVPDYLSNVELYNSSGQLLASPPLTPANLPMGPESANTYLNIPGDRKWLRAGDLRKTSIYVHALKWKVGPFTGADFQYFFFYPYNGKGFIEIRSPGIPRNDTEIPAGEHEGDWESIIIRTDSNGNVIGIYCNQHGSGQWYLPGQLTWIAGHPVIYVALSGHPSFNSIGHFPTDGGDWTFSLFGYTVGAQLDNVTGSGRQLPTAELAELVAATHFEGVQVQEPWWLDYRGRFGQVVFTAKDKQETSNTIAEVLGVLPGGLAEMFASEITSKVYSVLGEILPDGPEPPKAKGWWNEIRQDGPWALAVGRWSGNAPISSYPNRINPESRNSLALAPFGRSLCLAFRSRTSDQLYEAWYDGSRWRGNTPIQTATGGAPLSTHGPALAVHGDRLYMAYKAADSNSLYLSWFDGARWQGNTRIETDHGVAESTAAPALASYGGQLCLAFKGASSNALYLCRYDGGNWRGNTQIQTDHGLPRTTTGPALAPFNGELYMTFKGEESNQLYMARYDGRQWYGNTRIVVRSGAVESPLTPWMALFEGHLVMLFKGADSDSIYLAAFDGGTWSYNDRLSSFSLIQPFTNATGAIAPLGNLLITVFKGATNDALYQVECISSDPREVLVTQRLPR